MNAYYLGCCTQCGYADTIDVDITRCPRCGYKLRDSHELANEMNEEE